MQDGHDPKNTLREAPIQFTGDAPTVPIDEKLKKVLKYLGIAVAVTVLALLIPAISILLVISMPAAFGLIVYAGFIRYKAVIAAENKAPDWSKIKVPPPEETPKETEEKPEDTVTYS